MTPEGELKAKCRDTARQRKLVFVSIEGKQVNGIPDTICECYDPNEIVFVEFKRPGQRPTAQQWRRIHELRAAGAKATWTDDYREWLSIVGLSGDYHRNTLLYRDEDEL